MKHLILILACLTPWLTSSAQTAENPYPDFLEEVFMDMDFSENLATPKVPQEAKPGVAARMKSIAETFSKRLPEAMRSVIGTRLDRDNEVFVVTYPADELFNPNDTLLSKYADRSLQELIPLMKDPYLFKVVYAVSCDNTGSETYQGELTDTRMNSLYDWVWKMIDANKIPEEMIIIPESLAASSPVADNLTRENRRKNRRIEFYFIPGPKLIEEASGKK